MGAIIRRWLRGRKEGRGVEAALPDPWVARSATFAMRPGDPGKGKRERWDISCGRAFHADFWKSLAFATPVCSCCPVRRPPSKDGRFEIRKQAGEGGSSCYPEYYCRAQTTGWTTGHLPTQSQDEGAGRIALTGRCCLTWDGRGISTDESSARRLH